MKIHHLRKLRRRFLLGLLIATVCPALFARQTLTASFSSTKLVIEGVHPGGSVAILAVEHESAYYMTRVSSRQIVLTDDHHDGTITFEKPTPIAFRSIWIIADLDTGEILVATPAGFRALEMRRRVATDPAPVDVGLADVSVDRDQAQVLVVRPGRGAWTKTVGLQRAGDSPVNPKRPTVAIDALHELHKEFGRAPSMFLPGDIVVAVDPVQLDYSITTISRGPQ